MLFKFLTAATLSICLAAPSFAQTKESTENNDKSTKEETITIRKKNLGDKHEKLTIVVDGDNITVNGKPLEELKDSDVEVLRNRHSADLGMLLPKLRAMAPAGDMKMLMNRYLASGNKAFLGVVSEKTEKGVRITSVEKESAAEKAGLKKDDIITKVGATKIETSEDLYRAIGAYKPADKISIGYIRDGKEAGVTATLGKAIAEPGAFNFKSGDLNFTMPRIPDMKGMDFNFEGRRPRLGIGIQDLEDGKGVKVLDVDNDTPAGKAGLLKDDVITGIDGKPVTSVDEFKARIRELKQGDSMKVSYLRNGNLQTTDIKFPKKLKTAEL